MHVPIKELCYVVTDQTVNSNRIIVRYVYALPYGRHSCALLIYNPAILVSVSVYWVNVDDSENSLSAGELL